MEEREFNTLRVLHRLKDACGHGLSPEALRRLSERGPVVDTCLRQVWITTATADEFFLRERESDHDSVYMEGREAYNFLLQTVTGLNSSIPGETNVMGQFRCAWKRWKNHSPAKQVAGLSAIMHRLFSDSKMVRRGHLENTGGASYGSLVRKILRPRSGARILFAGAGKFSQSMLPFFDSWETALWNHRFHKGLHPADQGTVFFAPVEITTAARWATHLVMTTPADDSNDHLWVGLAAEHTINHVVHLSRRRADPGIWNSKPGNIAYSNLDDVFDLRRKQTTLRDLNVLSARAACEHIAFESAISESLRRYPLAQRA